MQPIGPHHLANKNNSGTLYMGHSVYAYNKSNASSSLLLAIFQLLGIYTRIRCGDAAPMYLAASVWIGTNANIVHHNCRKDDYDILSYNVAHSSSTARKDMPVRNAGPELDTGHFFRTRPDPTHQKSDPTRPAPCPEWVTRDPTDPTWK